MGVKGSDGASYLHISETVDSRSVIVGGGACTGNLICAFKIFQVNIRKGNLNTKQLSKGSWEDNFG